MAKVVMTRYKGGIENRLVFPECPLVGKVPGYTSLEVICSKPTEREHYCSSMNEKGVCPFDAQHPSTSPPAPEPDEYLLITRKEFEQISHSYAVDISQSLPARKRCELLDTIRSRPLPAPRPPCEECQYQERIDKAARKAREDVLDAFAVDDFGDLFDKLINYLRIADEDADGMDEGQRRKDWSFKDIESTINAFKAALQQQAGERHE